VLANEYRLDKVNFSIFNELDDWIDFFDLVIEFILQIDKKGIAKLWDIEHCGWGFIDLCDLFYKFRFNKFIVSGDFFLERRVFLDFLIVGLEEFDNSCRDSS